MIMQMNTHKYGHGSKTKNKKLIKRRNDTTQGWQFCSVSYHLGKRKGEKRKKTNYYNTGDSNLVTHLSTNPAEQGLTSLSGQNMFLVI